MSARPSYEYWLVNWSDIQNHLSLLFKNSHGDCLEIGTRRGVSTAAILAGVEQKGGHLWSVDINDCRIFEGHKDWTFIQADSLKQVEKINASVPAKLDVLFVDGDHSFEGALSDLDHFGTRAKKIFVHDTDAPDFPGVRDAVLKFCASRHRMVKFHSGSYGMAEIS